MADYVIVGSGINALVARRCWRCKGRKVLVLERNDRIGGCIRTEEITAPGFVHDVMATTFVLFITSPAYARARQGTRRARPGVLPSPTCRPACCGPMARMLVLTHGPRRPTSPPSTRSPRATARNIAADVGEARRECAASSSRLLGGSLWSWRHGEAAGAARPGGAGPRGLAAFFGEALVPARALA